MQSADRYRIALLAAYALSLHGLESFIPMPLPWLRAGLANIITLTTLLLFGFRDALMVTLIRVLLASVINGSFPGPGFILSLGGGLAGVLSMGLVFAAAPRLFGPVGLSLIGAFFHNAAQLSIAWLLFIQRLEPILLIGPVLLLIGTATGVVNGLVADLLVRSLKKSEKSLHNTVS
jgi:heptaprenyl diphosphate synthase